MTHMKELKPLILIVEDSDEDRFIFEKFLKSDTYRYISFSDVPSTMDYLVGRKTFEKGVSLEDVDLIVTDLVLGDRSGLELMTAFQKHLPYAPVIFQTGHASVGTAVEAMKLGAFDYFEKPFNFEKMRYCIKRGLSYGQLQKENMYLKNTDLGDKESFGYKGEDQKIKNVLMLAKQYARSDASVLITGESGTGKELIAKALYQNGPRKEKPFFAINCSAIPEALLESELFGHSKGSFTGAHASRKGLFEEADGGTLFLDEIGDLPLLLQAKLLRVLQEKKVKPVGSNQFIDVDVRIVAATHKSLKEAIAKGTFREDLYYRICVLPIHLPALRDRKGDIPLLAYEFLKKSSIKHGIASAEFSEEALEKLMRHKWDGNVRELQNVIERAVVLGQGKKILRKHIILENEDFDESIAVMSENEEASEKILPLKEIEGRYIQYVLNKTNGKKDQAAKLLGIDRKTLYRKEQLLTHTDKGESFKDFSYLTH